MYKRILMVMLATPDLMNPDEFEKTATKLATIEAQELHFMGCYEAAETETTIFAFDEKLQHLLAQPHESNVHENPLLMRCREYCMEQFRSEYRATTTIYVILINR